KYKLEHYAELDKARELVKNKARLPPQLVPVEAKYQAVNTRDKELKKSLAEAKDAVEKEKRPVSMSLGTNEDLETLKGEMLTKRVDLTLTTNGQPQPYVMTLRRYEMASASGPQSR